MKIVNVYPEHKNAQLLFSPDFSDSGKRRARKSWIRPQNTVFWDLDSLLRRSSHSERCYKQLCPLKPCSYTRMKYCTYHCTSSTSSSSQQYKKSSRKGESTDTMIKWCILWWRNTATACTERFLIIYRFPGGNILLDEREYFVTLVKGEAVQYISQQDERSCRRADTCMERVKQGRKSFITTSLKGEVDNSEEI